MSASRSSQRMREYLVEVQKGYQMASRIEKLWMADLILLSAMHVGFHLVFSMITTQAIRKMIEASQIPSVVATTNAVDNDESKKKKKKFQWYGISWLDPWISRLFFFEPQIHLFSGSDNDDSAMIDFHKVATFDDNDCYKLALDVPGAQDLQVELLLHVGIVVVSGRRQNVRFEHRFSLDTNLLDTSKLDANLFHGVLTLSVPKRNGKVIPITTSTTNSSDSPETNKNKIKTKVVVTEEDWEHVQQPAH